uniref:uncharacterized protein LOC117258267 isoform X1 n=2 Tax=Epinephelus lanceolatus TaxID=310571 RepID=UPI001446CC4D|nr:uncharacterized protein LOC117258267 isoform X1 [Epinephelus lanceolatus]
MGSPWKGFVEFTLPASPPTAFVSADLSSTSPVGLSLSPYGRSQIQVLSPVSEMERGSSEPPVARNTGSAPSTSTGPMPIPRSSSVSCHPHPGSKKHKRTPLYQRSMSFDPGMLHNNGHTAYANGTGPGIRETGVVEKLLTSYGFIQCSERQARLFFHCSQYNGNLQELKIGDDVEFEVSSDRRTGKPIAVKLLKIKPEVLPEERISGQVGPDLHAFPFTVLHGYIHPVVSAIPVHLDGKSAPGQVPTGSVCYERNGVSGMDNSMLD